MTFLELPLSGLATLDLRMFIDCMISRYPPMFPFLELDDS